MEIGKNIRQIRLNKGLSQENVAEMLHVSTTVYGDIEQNTTEISVKKLLEIAKILGVNYNELIEYNTDTKVNIEEISKLKAELLLAQIESERWKERFFRSVFVVTKPKTENTKIGFK